VNGLKFDTERADALRRALSVRRLRADRLSCLSRSVAKRVAPINRKHLFDAGAFSNSCAMSSTQPYLAMELEL
jgi:hypothetical protein